MKARGIWVLAAGAWVAMILASLPVRAEEKPVGQGSSISPGFEPSENAAEGAVTVSVPRAVHFSGADGGDVLVEPGPYRVEAFETRLRLSPVGQGSPIVIEAIKGTHDSENEVALALALPGETEEEGDLFNVMLMVPGGTSLEATGTYSGVKPRGLFDEAFKKAKKGVSQAVQQTKKVATDVKKGVDLCNANPAACRGKGAGIAEAQAQQHLRAASDLALQAKQEAERLARLQACKVAVTAIKAGKMVGGFMSQVLPVAKQRRDGIQQRIAQDPMFREQLRTRMRQAVDNHQTAVPELQRITAYVGNAAHRPQMDALFTPDVLCGGSMAQFDAKLRQAGLVPNFSAVQARGVDDSHFYMGIQLTLDAGFVGGAQLGLFGVTDFRGNGGFYFFIGPQAGIVAGGGGVLEAIFFPKVDEGSFEGWGGGVGGTVGAVAVAAADVAFDESFTKFQGFGIGGGAGAGSKMVGSLAASYTHAWKL